MLGWWDPILRQSGHRGHWDKLELCFQPGANCCCIKPLSKPCWKGIEPRKTGGFEILLIMGPLETTARLPQDYVDPKCIIGTNFGVFWTSCRKSPWSWLTFHELHNRQWIGHRHWKILIQESQVQRLPSAQAQRYHLQWNSYQCHRWHMYELDQYEYIQACQLLVNSEVGYANLTWKGMVEHHQVDMLSLVLSHHTIP